MQNNKSPRIQTPMQISYSGLWTLLREKRISNHELITICGLNKNTVTRLRNNQCISFETMYRICFHIGANIGDIVHFEEEPKTNSSE